ncbi:hypothetical protein R6Z07F_007353 [Ovis aries]
MKATGPESFPIKTIRLPGAHGPRRPSTRRDAAASPQPVALAAAPVLRPGLSTAAFLRLSFPSGTRAEPGNLPPCAVRRRSAPFSLRHPRPRGAPPNPSPLMLVPGSPPSRLKLPTRPARVLPGALGPGPLPPPSPLPTCRERAPGVAAGPTPRPAAPLTPRGPAGPAPPTEAGARPPAACPPARPARRMRARRRRPALAAHTPPCAPGPLRRPSRAPPGPVPTASRPAGPPPPGHPPPRLGPRPGQLPSLPPCHIPTRPPPLSYRQGVQAWRGGRSRLERRPPRRPGPAVSVLGAPGRVWAVGGGGAAVKQQSARREEGEGEGHGGEGKAPAAGSDAPRSPCRAAPTINSLSKHRTTARASESDK